MPNSTSGSNKGPGRRGNPHTGAVDAAAPSANRGGGAPATTSGLVGDGMPTAPVEHTSRPARTDVTLKRGD